MFFIFKFRINQKKRLSNKMRFKRRYFSVEIIFQQDNLNQINKFQINKLKHTQLSEAIHNSIAKLYGDYGMAVMMPSFNVIYFNTNTNLAILRTSRDLKDKFHTLLTFTKQIGQFDVSFRVIHISGSIRKCKKFLLNYCQLKLAELYKQMSLNSNMKLDVNQQVELDNKASAEVYEKLLQNCETNDNLLNLD